MIGDKKMETNKVKKTDFNDNHPELREDEMFVGNVLMSSYEDSGWESKRLGKIAYTASGVIIEEEPNMYPLFKSKNETTLK